MEVNKAIKQLRFIFILSIITMIVVFIADVLYVAKYVQITGNIPLERWGIILTLGGIFGSLKFLHPRPSDNAETDISVSVKKYTTKYYVRLLSLIAIFIFNIASLHITGTKNFMFLAFIAIFAVFLCAPNRKHIEPEIDN